MIKTTSQIMIVCGMLYEILCGRKMYFPQNNSAFGINFSYLHSLIKDIFSYAFTIDLRPNGFVVSLVIGSSTHFEWCFTVTKHIKWAG